MATLTPVDHDPFAAGQSGPALTPVEGDPFADQEEYAAEVARIRAARSQPHVPSPVESELKLTPEQEAFEIIKGRRAERAAQDAYENRTLGERARDTAAFAASMPVRMVTKGEYGLGDVAELVGERPEFADAIRQAESGFVQNNQAGLEAAAAVGDVAAGIPMLSSMGAVPGQMLRTSAAAARQLPRSLQEVMADTRGMAKFAGGGDEAMAELARIKATKAARVTEEAVPDAAPAAAAKETPIYDASGEVSHYIDDVGNMRPAAVAQAPTAPSGAASAPASVSPPASPRLANAMQQGSPPQAGGGGGGGGPVPPSAAGSPPMGPRPPSNADVIAAAQRIDVPLMRAMAGNRVAEEFAGGMSAIPYAGTPIANAFERGQQAMGDATKRAVSRVGTASDMAGEDLNRSLVDWVKNTSRAEETDLYKGLNAQMNGTVKRQPTALRKAVQDIQDDMSESTSKVAQPAIDMVQEAVNRTEGLTFRGKLQLRTDIGQAISDAKLSGQGGTAIPAYKRLYAALSDDLEKTAMEAGGQKAVDAFKRVNSAVDDLNSRREEIQSLIGNKGQASEATVLNRVEAYASTKGGDMKRLEVIRRAAPEQFKNAAAELVDRMGIDTATGQWSHNRFLTAYGKYSDAGKQAMFGPAKTLLDDIATVAGRYKDLEKLGNSSGTGRVNAVIKIITDPRAILGASAGAAPFAPGIAAIGGASALTGFAAGRRLAWYLAADVTKSQAKAGRLIKSYYGVESALKKGGKVLVENEQALDNSIRSFAASLADETGQSADDIEKNLREAIDAIRAGKAGPRASLTDTMMKGGTAPRDVASANPGLMRAMARQGDLSSVA